jgi:hypothetical protein
MLLILMLGLVVRVTTGRTIHFPSLDKPTQGFGSGDYICLVQETIDAENVLPGAVFAVAPSFIGANQDYAH